jgi:hypothetical protein
VSGSKQDPHNSSRRLQKYTPRRSKAPRTIAHRATYCPNVHERKASEKDREKVSYESVDRNNNGNQQHSWRPRKILPRRLATIVVPMTRHREFIAIT